jgi:hypothetical protein
MMLIDLFGNEIIDRVVIPPASPEDQNLWSCSGCRGSYPASLPPDIELRDDPTKVFCGAECAETFGYPQAALVFRRAYEDRGDTRVVLTADGRLPDPRSAQDREKYPDLLRDMLDATTDSPPLPPPPATADGQ